MSNIPPPRISSQNRLYKGLITTLKILQFVGYLVVALYSFVVITLFSDSYIFYYRQLGVILALISLIIGCIIVYVTTQVFIAIIDLLSRIEENTR